MDSNIKKKRNLIIAIVSVLVGFVVLFTLATIYDLQISKELTNSFLGSGDYFSTSQFGIFFECVGSTPIFVLISISAIILLNYFSFIQQTTLKFIVKIGCIIVSLVALYFAFSQIEKYFASYLSVEAETFIKESIFVSFIELCLASLCTWLLFYAWKNVSAETNNKLVKWAYIILILSVGYLIVWVLKTPIGRVRFRTMNALGDFSLYTPWYKINGANNIELPLFPFIDDACKSFPSGHTYSGATIFAILCLPDLVEKLNKKWIKISLYVVSILYVVMVAISRIIIGAHFTTDVLFSSILAFMIFILAREIIVFKCENIKLIFTKQSKIHLV